MNHSVPILLYHHVSPDRDMTPAAFERQLSFLLERGYQSLSLEELLEIVHGAKKARPRAFAVTFDDGYLDNWVYAFPVLEKLKVKAAFYLVTDYVESAGRRGPKDCRATRGPAERSAGGFLSWEEARAMDASGLITWGSHTQTHRHWIRKNPYPDVERELKESKALIERQMGRSCSHLSWPWGDFEKNWWPLLERAGYRSAVTTLAGANAAGTPPYALKRMNVSRPSVDWLSSRLRWHASVWSAAGFGLCYGWDRRLKSRFRSESPYSYG